MLKIWLPFDKDKRNIGLSEQCRDFKTTNFSIKSGSPIENKSCAFGYGLYHCDSDEFENDFTVATWVRKDTAWSVTNSIVSVKNIDASNKYQWYMSIFSSTTQTGIRFNINNGGEWASYNFLRGTWYHVAGTYNGTTKNYAIYVNGEQIKTGQSTAAKTTGCTNIGVCCRSTTPSGSAYTGDNLYISNFKIFSHELHDWEIKKLYNSCFYEMESNIHLESTNNLIAGLNYSVGNLELICSSTDDSDGGKYVTTGGQNGSFTGHTIRLNLPSGIPLTDGLPYTFSYRYKKVQGNGDMQSRIEINDGSPVIKAYPLYDMTKVEVIALSGSNRYSYASHRFLDYNNVAANSKYKMYDFQVEQKDHATPYTPSNRDERFVDMSGLDNEVVPYNITQSGTSLYFNGTDSAIKVPITKIITGGTWSINLWFYRPNGQFGSKSWETLIGGPSGFEFQSKRSSGTSPILVAYSWGQSSSGGKAYEYDKWNMVTMVRTPSQFKAYLNGENFLTTTSAGSVPNGDYFIGAWQAYNKQNFKGYMKRFSIYTKVLSDDDVMNLYLHNE